MVTEEAIYSRGQFCDVGLEVSSESSTRVFLSGLFEDFADPVPCSNVFSPRGYVILFLLINTVSVSHPVVLDSW